MGNPKSQSPMRLVFKIKPPVFFAPFHKSKSLPPLRIADVLLLQEHQEEKLLMDGCGVLHCSTPRRIAARLFSGLKRGKVKRMVGFGGGGDSNKKDDNVTPPHVTGAPPAPSSTETYRSDSCNFNVGIGCCLVHLITESKNELQKMTELRIQMETALEKVKDELRKNNLQVAKNIESTDLVVEEPAPFNSNLKLNKELFDQSLKCEDVAKEHHFSEGMDRLEAELEAELERLEFHLSSTKLPANPAKEIVEESTIKSAASVRSNTISCGEVIDPTIDNQEEDGWDPSSGVPPYELERKLHELLETRQQEQIRELEAALRRARRELREKEREISWWKETAHLMSRHFKEPSRHNFLHGEHSDDHFLSVG